MTTARTGSGDGGYTDLLGGRRVAKYDLIPEALGELDEATSCLGVAKSQLPHGKPHERVRELIEQAQHDLYELMAELAFPVRHAHARRIGQADVERLDKAVTQLQATLRLPSQFILPGASRGSAPIDLARAVVRRAERAVARVVHAARERPDLEYPQNAALVAYLNRLSLLLFVLARLEDALNDAPELLAGRGRRAPPAGSGEGNG
jgi:ATP:cob(I)alamin adenosyltransferase